MEVPGPGIESKPQLQHTLNHFNPLHQAGDQTHTSEVTRATAVELFPFFIFLGPHRWHMEAPRLGVKSKLLLPAYTTATQDPSHTYTTARGKAGSLTP